MQLTHDTSNFKKQAHPITVVCDNVTNAPNIGSLFRIADAFGVEALIFCGTHVNFGRRMLKTSRSTENYVTHKIVEDSTLYINKLKADGYFLVALEITENSKTLTEFKLPKNKRIALILGNENFGVSEDNLKEVDAIVHITMFGNNSSMNVVQAASIALYEITKQLKT